MRLIGHRLIIRWLVIGLTFAPALTSAAAAPAEPRPVEIRARPIDHFMLGQTARVFGQLEFLGGLELTAEDEDFGSWSGLDFDSSGRLLAVSDRGYWLAADLVEDASGKPFGLANAVLAPMQTPNGAPATKATTDPESARASRLDGEAAILVSFERIHQLWLYTDPLDLTETPRRLSLPAFVRGLKANKSLEALAASTADGPLRGAVVVLAERSLDDAGNHRGFVLSGPRAGAFSVSRSDGFDITDAVFLPDGDLVILERRFSYRSGVALRMRLIRTTLIRPDAVVDGATLIEAGMVHQIDNLEGLAVRTDRHGRTILSLVSDNNHSLLQRSLLLQFALTPPTVPLPRLRPDS